MRRHPPHHLSPARASYRAGPDPEARLSRPKSPQQRSNQARKPVISEQDSCSLALMSGLSRERYCTVGSNPTLSAKLTMKSICYCGCLDKTPGDNPAATLGRWRQRCKCWCSGPSPWPATAGRTRMGGPVLGRPGAACGGCGSHWGIRGTGAKAHIRFTCYTGDEGFKTDVRPERPPRPQTDLARCLRRNDHAGVRILTVSI
jgi:hypothetical protein